MNLNLKHVAQMQNDSLLCVLTHCLPPFSASVCAVRPEGSSSEVLHPQKPLPVPSLVHCHILLLRVPHVLPNYAQHLVSGDAGMQIKAV